MPNNSYPTKLDKDRFVNLANPWKKHNNLKLFYYRNIFKKSWFQVIASFHSATV